MSDERPADPSNTLDAGRTRRLAERLLACFAVVSLFAIRRGLLPVVSGAVVSLPMLVVGASVTVLLMRLRSRARHSTEGRIVGVVSALTLVAGLAVWGTAVMSDATYRVLPNASTSGCRVVVREDSFLMSGGGSIYVLHGTTGIAHRVRSFETDDGLRPFTNNEAELVWHGERATISGPLWDPRDPAPFTFGC